MREQIKLALGWTAWYGCLMLCIALPGLVVFPTLLTLVNAQTPVRVDYCTVQAISFELDCSNYIKSVNQHYRSFWNVSYLSNGDPVRYCTFEAKSIFFLTFCEILTFLPFHLVAMWRIYAMLALVCGANRLIRHVAN